MITAGIPGPVYWQGRLSGLLSADSSGVSFLPGALFRSSQQLSEATFGKGFPHHRKMIFLVMLSNFCLLVNQKPGNMLAECPIQSSCQHFQDPVVCPSGAPFHRSSLKTGRTRQPVFS